MENIFAQFPIEIKLSSFLKDDISRRILLIKTLYKNGVDWDVFEGILSDLHSENGIESLAKNYPRRNCFTLNNWSRHFANNRKEFGEEILIDPSELELVFEYLRNYHSEIIVKVQKDIYQNNSMPSGENFRMEYIIFKSLEIE